MSGHTPGPWTVNEFRWRGGKRREVQPEDGYGSVAHVLAESGPPEQNDANARLIAAAPELLQASIYALEALEAADQDRFDGGYVTGLLRAAIAKAKGEEVAS